MSSAIIRMAAGAVLLTLLSPAAMLPQDHVLPLPLAQGTTVVQTLWTPDSERESFLTAQEVSPKGTRWTWNLTEVHEQGDTVKDEFAFVEATADVAEAFRIRVFEEKQGPLEHPGYTMMAVSRAVYHRLRATGADTFQVMEMAPPSGARLGGEMLEGLLGKRREVPVRWGGTLSVVNPTPAPFPLLVNGQRTEVSALHLRGNFRAKGRRFTPEIWILADSTYPLVLKWVGHSAQPTNVLQTVRVDFPLSGDAGGSGQRSPGGGDLELHLGKECRAELPGIYFAFNSALLDPASDRTIARLADILAKHPDWTGTIEGHTDSVGTPAANRTLSERRAEAVRTRLVEVHKVDGARLRGVGVGMARPRETNATIEGRARNRRVEVVRKCAD